MWITEQNIPFIHYKCICSVVCIYTQRTPHWQPSKLYFNLNICLLRAGCAWQMKLYWVFFAPNTTFLLNKACLCEHLFPLYPQLLPVTLCYLTLFNLADGHFPAHHSSSPLPFFSPLSPALLCTPLSHTSILSLLICSTIRSSFLYLFSQACLLR